MTAGALARSGVEGAWTGKKRAVGGFGHGGKSRGTSSLKPSHQPWRPSTRCASMASGELDAMTVAGVRSVSTRCANMASGKLDAESVVDRRYVNTADSDMAAASAVARGYAPMDGIGGIASNVAGRRYASTVGCDTIVASAAGHRYANTADIDLTAANVEDRGYVNMIVCEDSVASAEDRRSAFTISSRWHAPSVRTSHATKATEGGFAALRASRII